jgi:hypothetical protein
MNFHFSPEQAAFQREVTDFIERGMPADWDAEHGSL